MLTIARGLKLPLEAITQTFGILETLYEAYPNCLTKEEVAVRTDYSVGGGGFNNALSKLRTLELIEGRGTLTAGEVFFE